MTERGRFPRISIAVPSFNQGPYIRETLESLVRQEYPNLEVIIQDGGSTDGAIQIAQEFADRYPEIFRLHVQQDTGHANAVNLAFTRSTGEILGYLNTDDTLYPGCLHRVAREIDPARGRYIVFGRCLFTGGGSPYVGREHPAEYRGHFEMLAVWKRGYNTIPQPSTFWHRKVYETCGGFDEADDNAGLDYKQWCRFSKRFAFHVVDEVWSTYRMHPVSVTSNQTEQERLDAMVGYSRSQWGPWWRPLRWRCTISYWLHDRDLAEQARARARRAEGAARAGRYAQAAVEFLQMSVRSPRMTAYWASRLLASRAPWVARRLRAQREDAFTGRYSDNWIGPMYKSDVSVPADARRLVVTLEHQPNGHHRLVTPALCLNGKVVDWRQHEAGKLALAGDLSAYRGRSCEIEIRTPEFFVPRFVNGSPDDRELSVLLVDQRIESE